MCGQGGTHHLQAGALPTLPQSTCPDNVLRPSGPSPLRPHPDASLLLPPSQVGYFHAEVEGVDYVFVDHPCFNVNGGDLYSGSRADLLFRCSLLSKAALEAVSGWAAWSLIGLYTPSAHQHASLPLTIAVKASL